MSDHITIQELAIAGIAALSNMDQLNNKSATMPETQPKPTPYSGPIILKAPKNPQDHLSHYYKLTTPVRDHGFEHDLDAGFIDIWSAYNNRGDSSSKRKP